MKIIKKVLRLIKELSKELKKLEMDLLIEKQTLEQMKSKWDSLEK